MNELIQKWKEYKKSVDNLNLAEEVDAMIRQKEADEYRRKNPHQFNGPVVVFSTHLPATFEGFMNWLAEAEEK